LPDTPELVLRLVIANAGPRGRQFAVDLSLRSRLLLGFLVTVGLTGLVSTVVGTWLMDRGVTEQAQNKSRHDLKSARLIYDHALDEIRRKVEIVSRDPRVQAAVDKDQLNLLSDDLENLRRREELDVLVVLDAHGEVRVRARNPTVVGDNWRTEPVVSRILAGAGAAATTRVLSEAALLRESPDLASRARIDLLVPEGQPPTLTDGLVLEAASKVALPDSQTTGIVLGWKLLNRDVAIVDRIKRTLYGGDVFRGREIGEGTICLGDVRVATNAVLSGTRRAVGSRVDPAVRSRVLLDGTVRVDRADVLGETHLTAYEPLKNIDGEIVGILCLGIPEERFAGAGRQATIAFMGISLGGLLLSLVISGFMARSITRPIHRLVRFTEALATGEFDGGRGERTSIREIDVLGMRFNEMAAAIERRDQQLKHRTQEVVGRSERLAMIGRLAAGVAHEINNPLGGIMLFSNLLLRKTPAEDPRRDNLERIGREAKRCQKIVQGLLDFARHRPLKVERVHVAHVIEQTLDLVRQQAKFLNIELLVEHDECPPVMADACQLQQVIMNVIMNAAEAMDERGTLSIKTSTTNHGATVQALFRDTGRGMSPEQLDKLFEPFFTTKEVGHGTGLGLPISRGIVESHGGTMWATSIPGETCLYFELPAIKDTP